jgi:hypothetical protein
LHLIVSKPPADELTTKHVFSAAERDENWFVMSAQMLVQWFFHFCPPAIFY